MPLDPPCEGTHMLVVVLTSVVAVGLVLTLWLPIYPQGMTVPIAAFGLLCTLGGLIGAVHRRVRHELVLFAPWALALFIGLVVGGIRGTDTRQALEDALPFLLCIAGYAAARAAASPRAVLELTLWVCVADSVVALACLPHLGPGIRSTYFYFKITAGLPLVGLYLIAVLHDPRASPTRRASLSAAGILLVVSVLLSVSRGMIIATLVGMLTVIYAKRRSTFLILLLVATGTAMSLEPDLLDLGAAYFRLDQISTVEGRLREIDTAFAAFAERPLLGSGLGASIEVDGRMVAFVHNMVAYHLWKLGLVGSLLLCVPIASLALRARSTLPRALLPWAMGGSIAVGLYLVTSAAYKTYYLVWIYGIVAGASRHGGRHG